LLGSREPYPLTYWLMHGSGLRQIECYRPRVKDVDLARGQLVARAGKGGKSRPVILPVEAREPLAALLRWRQELHKDDMGRELERVEMPDALERKYPRVAYTLGWQFVSASRRISEARERAARSAPSPRERGSEGGGGGGVSVPAAYAGQALCLAVISTASRYSDSVRKT
jgi:integrase